uniref:Uncharacterized protein LOC104227644 n=1 Tax=Nicotiana sylvestris TaxID=4096 RepID=A0A1U7WLR4_NICSY|nr:PREDICTED: uncharacterized protein LOC104227644 [Nicotiana sylvestris]
MVSWEVLEETLRRYGFSDKFIHWIMVCVSTTMFIVKVNGEGHGYFAGKRGSRFHPMCKETKLTHLIFVDDLMIFCKGNTSSVNRVMEALDHFSKVFGLIANMEQCSIFVAGVEDDIKDQLLGRTCFTAGIFPIKYLGLPLSPKKWNKMDCQMLIGKIIHRINITCSKQLSYAGRLQIVNVVLFSIHSFWENVFILPQNVVNGVDMLCREYLWEKKEGHKKVALVAWDKNLKVAYLIWRAVAQPKHRFIGWLATLGRLLTKDMLIGMQLQVENINYNLCNEGKMESQDHLFVKCSWINALRQELNLWLRQTVQITGIKQMLEQIKRKHWKQFKKK